MTNWNKHYQENTVTAEEAITHIHNGDTVVFSHAAVEPTHIIRTLLAHADRYQNVEIIHMIGVGGLEYCRPEYKDHFHHNSFFASGGKTKQGISEGFIDVTPCCLSQVADILMNRLPKVDVFVGQMSPPDAHGYCSLGIDLTYERAGFDSAAIRIMQVNPNMPRVHGETFVHVSQVQYFVPCNDPLIEIPRPVISDVEMALGKNCADLIEDGSTLQLGIGSLPDAICKFLQEKNDLGIHSEMISDGVMELIEAGVVNNRKKTLHRGKTVAAFAMGTRKLYDFINDNPSFMLMDGAYVNDAAIIAQNNKMISINSCVEIDFYGQAASESVGKLQISGTGGQTDFVRGATRSPGGKSLIVLQSTAQGGKRSKIVPFLGEGTPVTLPRTDIDYVVTEYGVAALRGKCIRERAQELIHIAHPNFREELIEAWEKFFCQKFPREVLN